MVAASGFTPEVHLWAVQFGKSATSSPFQQVRFVLYSKYVLSCTASTFCLVQQVRFVLYSKYVLSCTASTFCLAQQVRFVLYFPFVRVGTLVCLR